MTNTQQFKPWPSSAKHDVPMKMVIFAGRVFNVPESAKFITLDVSGEVWSWEVQPVRSGDYWTYDHPDDQGWRVGNIGQMLLQKC